MMTPSSVTTSVTNCDQSPTDLTGLDSPTKLRPGASGAGRSSGRGKSGSKMQTPTATKSDQCPICGQAATLVADLDRYVHIDGSSNQPCWLAILRGGVPDPCPRCRGEEYLDGDNGMVLCPRCCGTGDA